MPVSLLPCLQLAPEVGFISWFLESGLFLFFLDCSRTIHLSVCYLDFLVVHSWSSPCSSAKQENLSMVPHVTWQPGLLQMQLWMSMCAVSAREISLCVEDHHKPQFSSFNSSLNGNCQRSHSLVNCVCGFSSSKWAVSAHLADCACREAWFSTLITALIQAWPSDHSSFKCSASESHLVSCSPLSYQLPLMWPE